MAFCFLPLLSIAQSNGYTYKEITQLSDASKIALTPEEDIILMGSKKLIKIDNTGTLIWESPISVSSASNMSDMVVSADGNIFVSANIELEEGDFGATSYPGIIKFNADGDSLWFKSPFLNEIDTNDNLISGQVNSITQKESGELIITGFVHDTAQNQPLLVAQISTNGDTEWLFTDTLNMASLHLTGKDLIIASDGNIYVTGISKYTGPTIWGWYGAMLTKFDSEGNFVYNKRYPTGGLATTESAWSLLETQNKIILYTTDYEEEDPPLSIFRELDYDGNLYNIRYFGNEFTPYNLRGIYGWGTHKLSNEGFLHFGASLKNNRSTCFGIISKFDSELCPQWAYAIGDSTLENYNCDITDATEFSNGNLAFTGNVSSNSLLIITDANGNGNYPGYLLLDRETPLLKEFQVYPNPAKNSILVSLENNESCNYSIFSIDGRVQKSGLINGERKLDISNISSGIVFLMIDGYQTKKIVVK